VRENIRIALAIFGLMFISSWPDRLIFDD